MHIFRLTNHLLTWDSIYNFHDSQNIIHLGRCFLTLSCGISSYYDLQWINRILSLLYLICNKALSVIEGVAASDYNGISTMSLPDGL